LYASKSPEDDDVRKPCTKTNTASARGSGVAVAEGGRGVAVAVDVLAGVAEGVAVGTGAPIAAAPPIGK
jgi:hypothetical protein